MQCSFAEIEFDRRPKTTKRQQFLVETEAVIPWVRLLGTDIAVLQARKALYEAAKAMRPERWRGSTRNWDRPASVWLNPAGKPDLKLKLAS